MFRTYKFAAQAVACPSGVEKGACSQAAVRLRMFPCFSDQGVQLHSILCGAGGGVPRGRGGGPHLLHPQRGAPGVGHHHPRFHGGQAGRVPRRPVRRTVRPLLRTVPTDWRHKLQRRRTRLSGGFLAIAPMAMPMWSLACCIERHAVQQRTRPCNAAALRAAGWASGWCWATPTCRRWAPAT